MDCKHGKKNTIIITCAMLGAGFSINSDLDSWMIDEHWSDFSYDMQ